MQCCVCQEAVAKYCCPGCQRRTCSLECVQRHKDEWKCSGKRSRTEYTSLRGFTDQDLISDLRFLEDVKRVKEANWRNLRRVALVLRPQEIPPHQRKLRYEARQRGIRLHYLPRGMVRNKCNSSWFDFKREEICWDIDWVIPFLNEGQRIRKKRVPESETVAEALNHVLSPLHLSNDAHFVAMKKIGCPSNETVYFEFISSATLKSQLQGTELVEYPVLMVFRDVDRPHYNLQLKDVCPGAM